MDDPLFQLVFIVVAALVGSFVSAFLRTLGARIQLTIARHNLLVESKHRRLAFEQELAALRRREQARSDVMVNDEEDDDEVESDVIIEDDLPLPAAA